MIVGERLSTRHAADRARATAGLPAREAGHGDLVARLRAYLYAATRNRALDWVSRESARRRLSERAAAEEGLTGGRAADGPDAGDGEQAELLHAIVQAIEAMPERRRVVCSLRWRQGMSLAEIATSLGISQKTVETQLSRGLKQLRDQFQPE